MKKATLILAAAGLMTVAGLAIADTTNTSTNTTATTSKKIIKSKQTTCVVSDEKLGEHGKPAVLIYQGHEVKFCCKDCIADFKKDPAKYMAKLDATNSVAPKAN